MPNSRTWSKTRRERRVPRNHQMSKMNLFNNQKHTRKLNRRSIISCQRAWRTFTKLLVMAVRTTFHSSQSPYSITKLWRARRIPIKPRGSKVWRPFSWRMRPPTMRDCAIRYSSLDRMICRPGLLMKDLASPVVSSMIRTMMQLWEIKIEWVSTKCPNKTSRRIKTRSRPPSRYLRVRSSNWPNWESASSR